MTEPPQLLAAGLEALSAAGAELGEVRVVDLLEEWIEVQSDHLDTFTYTVSKGLGVRALVNGAWGYSASNVRELDEVVRCARESAEIARNNAGRVTPVELGDYRPQVGCYQTPCQRNYFEVPPEQKVDLLLSATRVLGDHSRVVSTRGSLNGLKRKTWLASTRGTDIVQEITICGGNIAAIAAHDGEVQQRSYPMEHSGNVNAAGWEFIQAMDLPGEAERVREEALALLGAPSCPEGRRTLILEGSQLALQIHESCGHPSELDRALGEEISLAGCSFLGPTELGRFRYGSPIVTIYADSTSPGGPGTFGWDDEGVPAGRWDIIKNGILVGYLGSRETSTRVPGTCPGAMRADSWAALPIVRMVNVNLEPGTWTLDDMIADTDDGVLMAVNRSWSIDDFRINFQFGCEIGWEIKNGRIDRMVKNPVYTGITPEFWSACDAIADRNHYRMWGVRTCGKGDPIQIMHVGHGCSPARFRNVEIGNSDAR